MLSSGVQCKGIDRQPSYTQTFDGMSGPHNIASFGLAPVRQPERCVRDVV